MARWYGNSVFTFWGTTILLFTVAAPFYIYTINAQMFQFLHVLVNSCYFPFLVNSHPKGCKVESHCSFDLHFPTDLFMYFFAYLWKCLFQSFAHLLIGLFVFLLLSCRSSLNILDINPLTHIWFVNIFSHSVGSLSFLILSFDTPKVFFVFAFIYLFFWRLRAACGSSVLQTGIEPGHGSEGMES